MLKKNTVPVDLTGLSHDELHQIGKCFYEELKAVADKYKHYYSGHQFFKQLESLLNFIKKQLSYDERKVE